MSRVCYVRTEKHVQMLGSRTAHSSPASAGCHGTTQGWSPDPLGETATPASSPRPFLLILSCGPRPVCVRCRFSLGTGQNLRKVRACPELQRNYRGAGKTNAYCTSEAPCNRTRPVKQANNLDDRRLRGSGGGSGCCNGAHLAGREKRQPTRPGCIPELPQPFLSVEPESLGGGVTFFEGGKVIPPAPFF
eukprot:gene9856-biopygen6227